MPIEPANLEICVSNRLNSRRFDEMAFEKTPRGAPAFRSFHSRTPRSIYGMSLVNLRDESGQPTG
jgi:hypothetical protein